MDKKLYFAKNDEILMIIKITQDTPLYHLILLRQEYLGYQLLNTSRIDWIANTLNN
jgi:hypothetical protein